MSVRVRIPMALRAYAGNADEVEVAAATVGDALARLAERHPQLARHLLGDDGRVRSFVGVFLNDDDVRHLGGPAAALSPGDVVTLVPSVAGGASPGGLIRPAIMDLIGIGQLEILATPLPHHRTCGSASGGSQS